MYEVRERWSTKENHSFGGPNLSSDGTLLLWYFVYKKTNKHTKPSSHSKAEDYTKALIPVGKIIVSLLIFMNFIVA